MRSSEYVLEEATEAEGLKRYVLSLGREGTAATVKERGYGTDNQIGGNVKERL